MSADTRPVLEAIDRWERDALIDSDEASLLRREVAETAEVTTKRHSQYVLTSTGAIVLLIAGGLFLDWAWPLRNLSTTMGHSTGLIREQCPVW